MSLSEFEPNSKSATLEARKGMKKFCEVPGSSGEWSLGFRWRAASRRMIDSRKRCTNGNRS